ncbi:hypothetical protein [Piscirickettsia salmonis]|uniref:hypothetical protein n=1 Tax=Piscirickettsia salmonis TaxID=1238 RepID=UPI0007C8C7BA|nr:hypothetical protein A0O36_01729 [Piscirickettsiaceae bacterium NZ-RLO1]
MKTESIDYQSAQLELSVILEKLRVDRSYSKSMNKADECMKKIEHLLLVVPVDIRRQVKLEVSTLYLEYLHLAKRDVVSNHKRDK